MDPTKFSSLARPVDLRYPTNRAISIVAGAVFLIGTIYFLLTEKDWWSSLTNAGHLTISIFLTWALARELAPDHPISAFIGLPLMLVPLWFDQLPHLIPVVALLMILRTVSRITGQSAHWPDSILLVGLSIFFAWEQEYILSFGIDLGLLLDGWLVNSLKRHRYLASISLLATVGVMIFLGVSFRMVSIPLPYSFSLLNTIFLLVIIFDYSSPESLTDNQSKKIDSQRIRSAQLLAFGIMIVSAFVEDEFNVIFHFPFWGAITGINLYFLFRKIPRLM